MLPKILLPNIERAAFQIEPVDHLVHLTRPFRRWGVGAEEAGQ